MDSSDVRRESESDVSFELMVDCNFLGALPSAYKTLVG